MDTQTVMVEPKNILKVTAAQVLSERKLIEELSQARDEARRVRSDEIDRVKWDVYGAKIRAIEEERDNEIRALEAVRDKAIAEKEREIERHQTVITQAKRILEMLRLSETESLDISEDEVTTRDGTVENLGYLINDLYMKIRLFIITNRKPKNRYSLIAVGRSVFDEPLVKHPYDYGVNVWTTGRRFSILRVLRESHDPELLKKWLSLRKDLATETLAEYERLKQEYVMVKQQYKVEELAELILWKCPQCNNFMTIFDYCGGETPKCYRHEPHVDMVR